MNDVHTILFNMQALYSLILGIWATVMAGRNQSISGNYWGAVATATLLAAAVLMLGIIMTLMGLRPPRVVTYFVYMAWLVIIMPGLFTMLRGRDDRQAAIAFALLAFFNATTSFSMLQRAIVSPWT